MNAFLVLILLWLFVLTAIIVYILVLFMGLFRGKGRRFDQKISEVFGSHEKISKKIQEIEKKLQIQIEGGAHHYSRAGIVRFNPFERLGGEQSYCIALLNEHGNGIVMTFLYTRDGVRVYCKEVQKGKGNDGDLSQEEKKAIVKAGVL